MRPIKTFAFINGSLEEFDSLDEVLAVIDGLTIPAELDPILDGTCTVLLAPTEDEVPDEVAGQRTADLPEAHRGGLVVAGLAMLKTYGVRHPVLSWNLGGVHLMVVAPAKKLERWIKSQYHQHVPLAVPPLNKYSRWTVSISESGELMRIANYLGPRPGMAQA